MIAMIAEFFYSLLITIAWTLIALLIVGLPLLGISWGITRLTVLTLAESCLFAFINIAVLLHLLQTYLALKWFELWRPVLWLSIFSLIVAIFEGSLLHNRTDLTIFQATIVANGVNLLFAYTVFHSSLGSIPAFLRDTFFEDMIDDMDDVEIVSPPPRSHRKRKR
ncbi:MAG: hypothetical protein GY832_02880 [Chloroflexi bacterium]|nr:hypothetical protein [Chloroflexota bacterium]